MLFATWQIRGVWEHIEDTLRAVAQARGKVKWQVSVDSTTSRGHIHAAGARHDSVDLVAGEPADHGFGRSRGGWSTKTHLAVDQDRGLLAFHITGGLECSRKNGDVVYAASSWMCLNPSSYSCGVK